MDLDAGAKDSPTPSRITPRQIKLHYAKRVQRPIALKRIQEPAPKPAWRSKPSWFLIAEEDRMINPKTPTFHGKANAGSYPYVCRRPYTFAHRAWKRSCGVITVIAAAQGHYRADTITIGCFMITFNDQVGAL